MIGQVKLDLSRGVTQTTQILRSLAFGVHRGDDGAQDLDLVKKVIS